MRRLIIDLYLNPEDNTRFDVLLDGDQVEGLTAEGLHKVVAAAISRMIEALD